jgi:uncharacterized phage protein (TIGR01671 family)
MRELKFRAWDKRTRKMFVTGFHIIGETTCFDMIYSYCMEHGLRKGEVGLLRLNSVVIMQYTGMKDKNGKEIYEADVIRFFDGDAEGIAIVQWDDSVGWARFQPVFIKRDDSLDADRCECEVIGNSYANPRTIKGD